MPLDQETLDAINAATKAQLGRELPKALSTALEPMLAPIHEKFAALTKAPEKAPEGGKAPAGGEADPVAARISALEADLKKERDSRAKERRVAREERAFNDLRTALAGKVRPEALDVAAKHLFHAEKKITVADDGTVTFKHGDTDYSLTEGVAEYLKSKDAALFVPAPAPAAKRPLGSPPPRPAAPPGGPAPAQREDPLTKTLRDLGHTA